LKDRERERDASSALSKQLVVS